MSKSRLKLTNDDLHDLFNFREYVKLPERQIYCKIYGRIYTSSKDGKWLFDNKDEIIESFMTDPLFSPLWNALIRVVENKYAHLFTDQGMETKNSKWFEDSEWLSIHNKLEDCINYYKEVLINRMIRTRVIIFHNSNYI